MAKAIDTGAYFKANLNEVAKEFPELVANVRGKGLLIGYDVPREDNDNKSRALIMSEMKKRGVNVPMAGVKTIRCRPCLSFEKHHADVYTEILRETLKSLS